MIVPMNIAVISAAQVLPTTQAATSALVVGTTSTTLLRMAASSSTSNEDNVSDPRLRSITYMTMAMCFHWSGYEFVRNVSLALFTSTKGFAANLSSAYPLANAAISPFSLMLLYLYGRILTHHGPRVALRRTTLYSIAFLGTAASLLLWGQQLLPPLLTRTIIASSFLFQSSYLYWLGSQQWSFCDSVLTPTEGATVYGWITGVSSICCTVTASIVPFCTKHLSIPGTFLLTTLPLTASLVCGDRAYQLASRYGFDPARQQGDWAAKNKQPQHPLQDSMALFRRVPTLMALLVECLCFQSMSTLLNVSMVRSLQNRFPRDDLARSAFTGRFFTLVNAFSALLQFAVVPVKRFEPKLIWRCMPILPLLSIGLSLNGFGGGFLSGSLGSPLMLLASGLFLTKVMDYGVRSVVYNLVYQPLDFESRFVGKEIVAVFGSRFGKSGMSLVLSFVALSLPQLSMLAFGAAGSWWASTLYLSRLLPSRAQAQVMVEERQRENGSDSFKDSKNKSE